MPGKENLDAFSRWEEEKAFSKFNQEDKSFVGKIDSRLQFAEWIDDPKNEQLGRALALIYPNDSDDEDESKRKPLRVGRIFPLADDDSRHLIVFKNRRMVIVEPLPTQERVDGIRQKRLKDHKAMFAFKPTELLYRLEDSKVDLDEQIATVIDCLWEDAQVTMSNDIHDELPTFKSEVMVNRAMSTAKRSKEKREQRFNKDMFLMMDEYEKQFGKVIFPQKKDQPNDQPPAVEPPPTA